MFLVRHGETEFNAQGRLQGRFDSPLTPKGMAQAKTIGRHLQALINRPEDWAVECSPLGRAVATAEIIRMQVGIPSDLIIDDRLREVSLGSWDGLTRDEISRQWPGALGTSLRDGWIRSCPERPSERWGSLSLRGTTCRIRKTGETGCSGESLWSCPAQLLASRCMRCTSAATPCPGARRRRWDCHLQRPSQSWRACSVILFRRKPRSTARSGDAALDVGDSGR